MIFTSCLLLRVYILPTYATSLSSNNIDSTPDIMETYGGMNTNPDLSANRVTRSLDEISTSPYSTYEREETVEEHQRMVACNSLRLMEECATCEDHPGYKGNSETFTYVPDFTEDKEIPESNIIAVLNMLQVDKVEFAKYKAYLALPTPSINTHASQPFINMYKSITMTLARLIYESFVHDRQKIDELHKWLTTELNCGYPEVTKEEMFLYLAYSVLSKFRYGEKYIKVIRGRSYHFSEPEVAKKYEKVCYAYDDFLSSMTKKIVTYLEKIISSKNEKVVIFNEPVTLASSIE